jgi:hypothetical protein
MEIDLFYCPDCPNRRLARRHLDVALARARRAAIVRELEVRSCEEAQVLGMRGSPTILVDGRDPFGGAAGPAALACRLYQTESGLRGVPTVSQLVEALGEMKRTGPSPTEPSPAPEV